MKKLIVLFSLIFLLFLMASCIPLVRVDICKEPDKYQQDIKDKKAETLSPEDYMKRASGVGASKKMGALPELAETPADDDKLLVDDSGTSKSIQYLNLMDGEALKPGSVDEDALDFSDITLNDFTFDVGLVSKTEFGYLNLVISPIQAQIDALDIGTVDTSGAPVTNDIARFTDEDTIEGRSYSEFKADLDLEAGIDFYSMSAADAAFEAELDNEAGLYAALSDVALFYEPGDILQTNSGTSLPGSCTTGAMFLDTDADTDGSLYTCVSTDTWKEVDDDGGAGFVDTSGAPVANDFARFTDEDTIEGRSYAEVKTDLNLEIGTDIQAYGANLDTLTTPTNWRIFYSNDSATITELALGADGTYLKSNGAAVAPSFDTPAGAGTMTTIKENDVGVGDADITTLDFLGADFDLAETPDTEIQVIIAAAIARVADVDMEMLNDVTGEGSSGYLLKDDGDGTYSFTNTLSGVTFGGFTANRALETDGSGNLEVSLVTDTELALLDGKTGIPELTGESGYTGEHNFDDADVVIQSGTTLPANCTTGEIFVDTDADTDGSVYFCRTTDTWKEIDDDGGAGSGTMSTIDEGGVQVGDADIVTLNFGPGFDLNEDPDTEIDITLDLSEVTLNADTMTVVAGTDSFSYVGFFDGVTGDMAIKTHADFIFHADTGELVVLRFDATIDLEVPNGTNPTTDTPGQVAVDSDDNFFEIYGSESRSIPTEFPIPFSVAEPDTMDARDFIPFFTNNTGATITITKIYAMADDDDTDFRIEEYDADGSSNEVLVKAETCDTGSGPYTNDGQTTITNANVENGHILVLDFDDTDTPDYLHVTMWYTVGGVD